MALLVTIRNEGRSLDTESRPPKPISPMTPQHVDVRHSRSTTKRLAFGTSYKVNAFAIKNVG